MGCQSSAACCPSSRIPWKRSRTSRARYGGLARVPIRGKYLYVLSDPEMLKEMLITHRQKYMKNIRYRHIQALLGQGLLLSEAAEWRRQRVITQPAFKPEAIDNSVGWMGRAHRSFPESLGRLRRSRRDLRRRAGIQPARAIALGSIPARRAVRRHRR